MLRIKQFWTLAGLTALHIIRQPIFLLLTTACIVLTALTPLLLMHNFAEEGKLARDSGLAYHFVFGLFIAGYAACSSLAREMRSGTALAILSKPVDRDVFFLAKFFGMAGVILAFSTCAITTTLLSERIAEKFILTEKLSGTIVDWQTGKILIAVPIVACLLAGMINYRTRRPFESTAFGLLLLCLLLAFFISGFFDRMGNLAPFDFHVQWRIVPAGLLIAAALIMMSAFAISLSTRLTTVPTMAICSAIFLAGLMSDYLLGRNMADSPAAAFFYRVVPNWQHFWLSDALTGGGTIPVTYVLNAGLYAIVYSAAILCLGIISFRYVELKYADG